MAGGWTAVNTQRHGNKKRSKDLNEETEMPLQTEPCVQDTSNQLMAGEKVKPAKHRIKLEKGNKRIFQPSNDLVMGTEGVNKAQMHQGYSLRSYA